MPLSTASWNVLGDVVSFHSSEGMAVSGGGGEEGVSGGRRVTCGVGWGLCLKVRVTNWDLLEKSVSTILDG